MGLMIRKLALIAIAVALPLSGCKKAKELVGKRKKPAATPAPAALAVAPTPAPAEAAPKPEKPSGPPKVAVDTHAQVVVLCYHRLEGKAGGALSIEPALFEKQMEELKTAGIPVISMQDFLAWRRGEKNIPPKCAIITIDDGYVSGYDVGWPILKKYGYPFTMFVYLNYIGTGGKSVSWDKLAEMRDAGVDIGSHTVSHLDLRRKPAKVTTMDYDAWLKDEVERSKKTIEDKLGIKVSTIAYPFGLHNEKVNEACKEDGYEAAFTTYGMRLGISTSAMTLGRYDVTTKDAQGHDSFSVAVSFHGMMAPGGEPVLAQDAAASMITEPMNGETVTNPKPTIKANLATMGAVDAGSIVMRISGLGLVQSKFDPASKTISYTPDQPLKVGSYRVIIGAKSNGLPVETGWNFNYSPDGLPPPEATPVPATPALKGAPKPKAGAVPAKKKKP